MSWLRRRPRLSLRVLGGATPGQRLELELIVELRRATQILGFEVQLEGEQTVRLPRSRWRRRSELVQQSQTVCGAGRLARGTQRYQVRFQLPAALPATIDATCVQVRYQLRLRLRLPGWLDQRAVFPLTLAFPRDGCIEREPFVIVSNLTGPRRTEPYAELSVASATVAAGGYLVGAVALYNVAHVRYRSLLFELHREVRVLTRRGGRTDLSLLRFRVELPPRPVEGESIPFSYQLPSAAPPTYGPQQRDGSLWRIEWHTVAYVEVSLGHELRLEVPLTVVHTDDPAAALPPPAPPVGDARVDALWSMLARELELHHAPGLLSATHDDWTLTLQRGRRSDRNVLVVELRPAEPLGLGLNVQPARGLLRGKTLTLGVRAFDRHHRLGGHDREQLAALLGPWVSDWPAAYRCEATDEALRVVIDGVGTQREALEQLARHGLTGLRTLPVRYAALAPPRCIESLQPFGELTALLDGGRLLPAALRVDGRYHGRKVRLTPRWQGASSIAGLEISVEGAIGQSYLGQDGLLSTALPAAARQRVDELTARGPLSFASQGLRQVVAWPSEASAIIEALGGLNALLALLAGGAGPYR